MEKKNIVIGHTMALMTILIWGTTFISTKILLVHFSPIEILFFRFAIGYITLILVYPHKLKLADKKQEVLFAAAGLCGVTLYFLLENIALTFTRASNVGVIISTAPFFTAIFAQLFLREEKLKKNFFIGFAAAICGILLISFNGSTILNLNPIGDMLAVLASLLWAAYSILIRKISSFCYHCIQTTRRIFFYGLLFMIPALLIFQFDWNMARLQDKTLLFNLLYLGLGASALCFVTWNVAVKHLGAIKTSVYIYLVPVITVATSVVILKETITNMAVVGTILTMIGLFISGGKTKKGV